MPWPTMGCCTVGVKKQMFARYPCLCSFHLHVIVIYFVIYLLIRFGIPGSSCLPRNWKIYIGYKFTLAVMLFYTEPKIFALQKLQCVFVDLYIFRFVTMLSVRNLHSDTCWLTFARLCVGTDYVLCMIFAGICTVRLNTRYSIWPHTVYSCVSYDSDTT
jgi:hypothetical protein